MTTIQDIYQGAEKLINEVLRKEIIAQGHHLTGALEDSLGSLVSAKGKAVVMEGTAVGYSKFVNEGFPASSANYGQVPFLIEYFQKRGFPLASSNPQTPTAVALAFATVRKWMKEGMPTQSSKRFSSTGSRTQLIESAFIGAESKIDEYMSDGFDFVVEERFQKEKSEIV